MTKWMVGKGAKNVILISRSATISAKVAELTQECSEVDATITVYACDVTDASQVEKLVTTGVSGMPAIRGVIHGAMVLHVSTQSSPASSCLPPKQQLIRTLGYIIREDESQ